MMKKFEFAAGTPKRDISDMDQLLTLGREVKDLIEKQEKENNFDANMKGECICIFLNQ